MADYNYCEECRLYGDDYSFDLVSNCDYCLINPEKDENRFIHLVRDIAPSAQPETHEKRTETHACDLIGRQAALDALHKKRIETMEKGQDVNPIWECLDVVAQVPSAQPERKRGKWTEDNACEFCGFQPWYERDIHTLSYCPNCGARMDGDHHE